MNTEPTASSTAGPAAPSDGGRDASPKRLTPAAGSQPLRYYEVWGESLRVIAVYRTAAAALAGVAVVLAVLLARAMDRPPLVVRVDSLGRAEAVADVRRDDAVTAPEIHHFATVFTELYHGFDYYSYVETFRRAFRMMTPELQQRQQAHLTTAGILAEIAESRLKSTPVIARVEIVKDTREAVQVKVKGYRTVTSYLDERYRREIVYEAELVMRKVKRTFKAPWGLLLDHYRETVFKES
jgi:hypothetical protein